MTIRTSQSRYGSGNTPCNVFYCDRTNWYVIEGSKNVNRAPEGTDFENLYSVEGVMDVDCCTAGEPIESEDDLQSFLKD